MLVVMRLFLFALRFDPIRRKRIYARKIAIDFEVSVTTRY